MTIGERIKILRKSRGMTQIELGHMIGYSSTVISKMENEVRTVYWDDVVVIADVFGVETGYLIKKDTTEGTLFDSIDKDKTDSDMLKIMSIMENEVMSLKEELRAEIKSANRKLDNLISREDIRKRDKGVVSTIKEFFVGE